MTSAKVSAGSAAVNLLSGAAKAPAVSAGADFKLLLNQQTSRNAAGKAAKVSGSTKAQDDGNAAGLQDDRNVDAVQDAADVPDEGTAKTEATQAADQTEEAAGTKPAGETGDSKDTEPDGEDSGSDVQWAALMELLGQTAHSFVQQVADTLGISQEQLSGLMDELGMDQMDLLQPDGLKLLAMAAEGETDPMALLTNGELYGKVQELAEQLEKVLDGAGKETGIDPERLMELAKQRSQELSGMPAENAEAENPLVHVEITTEDGGKTNADEPDTGLGVHARDGGKAVTDTVGPRTEEHSGSGGQEGSKHGAAAGQEANPFVQTAQQFLKTAAAQEASGAQPVWTADTQDIMRQIMDYMKIQIKPDMNSMELQLHPENLGRLHIQVASREGVMTAQFVTQNEAVKNALESQIVQLRENFSEQGIKVEAIEVTVQPHAFEQNLEQGRGQNSGEPDKKGRTRKIDLNGLEDLEELPDDDQLAADMMAASGNTVDYMA